VPRDREPWVKVKIGARRSGKLATLPSDTARLGYFYVLLEAKVQRRMGVFDNRAHFNEVLGRFSRHLDAYITADLIHEAPSLCADCRSSYPSLQRGQLAVHDYTREQRDPTHADRQADYRGRVRDVDSDATVTPATVTNPVTNDGDGDGDRDAKGTADSRARGTTATTTTTATENLPPPPSPARDDPAWLAPAGGRRADQGSNGREKKHGPSLVADELPGIAARLGGSRR
jgi:hypothetical protein